MFTGRWPWLLIVVIGAAGLVVVGQGWRARGPDADVVSAMVRTVALVERGHIPRRGNLTDHNAFRPPGTSWLLVPGIALFDDPRIVELASSGLLYLMTLAGVFALARLVFGTPAAVVAVLIYAGSAVAMHLAGVLQPKAHPAFGVWMTYCTAQWVVRRDSRWLAAAVVAWAAGTYVHIEMVPMAIVFPAVWWWSRVPVSAASLLAAVGIVVAMWWPYLSFQADRGFLDLQSQLSLRHLAERGPILVEGCGEEPIDTSFRAWLALDVGEAGTRLASVADLTLMNVESRVLAGEFILLALVLAGMVAALAGRTPARVPNQWWPAAVAGLVASILATEFAVRWIASPAGAFEAQLVALRRVHVWLLLGGAALAVAHPRAVAWAETVRRSWRHPNAAAALALAILVPAAIVMPLSEPGVNRILALWPMQAVLAAAVVTSALATGARPWTWLAIPLIVAVSAANTEVLHRLRDWRQHGWSGAEPARVEALSYRSVRCSDER